VKVKFDQSSLSRGREMGKMRLTVLLSGVELAHKIKKGQFDTSTVEEVGVRAQQLWEAVLAA
jgi:hypothetical protein